MVVEVEEAVVMEVEWSRLRDLDCCLFGFNLSSNCSPYSIIRFIHISDATGQVEECSFRRRDMAAVTHAKATAARHKTDKRRVRNRP